MAEKGRDRRQRLGAHEQRGGGLHRVDIECVSQFLACGLMCQHRAVERALRRVSRNLGFERPRMRDHTLGLELARVAIKACERITGLAR